jgi:hypothetical protein
MLEEMNMNWTVKFNRELRIVETVFTGKTTGSNLRDATTRTIALANEQGTTGVLVDATGIQMVASTLDILDLPARQYEKDDLDRRTHVALILPTQEKEREDARFYETACVNRGWQVRSFPSQDEAIEWLVNMTSSNKP